MRDWVLEDLFEAAFIAVALSIPCPLTLWDSRSLKSVTVAGVHVDAEDTALLTESALACGEVMLVIKFV